MYVRTYVWMDGCVYASIYVAMHVCEWVGAYVCGAIIYIVGNFSGINVWRKRMDKQFGI